MTAPRWLPVAAVTLLAALLAWLNRGERVAVDLGIATFYRAPLVIVLFLSFLAGMMAMLWLGLRQDRRMREVMRQHGILPPGPAQEPARPAASAWGVAPAREDEERTAAWDAGRQPAPRAEEGTSAWPRLDGDRDDDHRAPAHPRLDPVLDGDHHRTSAHPHLDGDGAGAGDGTAAYPRLEENAPDGGDRTALYSRRDEDPAA